MSDSDDKTSIGLPDSERRSRVVALARRAKSKTARGIRRVVEDERLQNAVTGALVRLDRALGERENLEKIQSVLARAGNLAMERTFKASPDARLLFDYAQWCEDTRSREEVSRSVFRDGIRLPFDLLGLVERSLRGQEISRNEFEEKRDLMLDLLWNMATEAARPRVSLDEALEREGVPMRFRVLFEKARGIDRSGSPGDPQSRELTRRGDALRDPGIQFMLRSLPIFLQSYLLKLAVETLPDVASW